LKKATCLEVENLIWQRLDELPIKAGVALSYQGKRIRKTKLVSGLFLVAKWKRNYRNQTTKKRVLVYLDESGKFNRRHPSV
jgi:hypothetical protein